MNTRHDFCPGCGAQVYPEEAHCPFCGRKLHGTRLLPVLVGVGGTAVAIFAGGLVWWVLSTPPAQQETAAPAPASSRPAPAAVATAAPIPSVPAPSGPAPAESMPAPAAAAPPAPAAEPAAPPPGGKDQSAFVPGRAVAPAPPAAAPAAGGEQASLSEQQLPLPTVQTPVSPPTADAAERRAFAKSKQDSFAQNGLDLTVTTSGPEDTVLTIKFNFSAKTAAELIVAGPFPRQCEQRGFKTLLFADPNGTTWIYDLATQQLTQK